MKPSKHFFFSLVFLQFFMLVICNPWLSAQSDTGSSSEGLPESIATGLPEITRENTQSLSPVIEIEPRQTQVWSTYAREANEYQYINTGTWFYGDEAGRTLLILRGRGNGIFWEPDQRDLCAYNLDTGEREVIDLAGGYGLSPDGRTLVGFQNGGMVIKELYIGSQGRWSLSQEVHYLQFTGNNSFITEGVIFRLDDLPYDTGQGINYPFTISRRFPFFRALSNGAVVEVMHEDFVDFMLIRCPHIGTQRSITHQVHTPGQVQDFDTTLFNDQTLVLVIGERHWFLITLDEAGNTLEFHRYTENMPTQGRVCRLSEELAAAAVGNNLILIIDLDSGEILHQLTAPGPVIQLEAGGNRLLAAACGPEAPGILYGIQ